MAWIVFTGQPGIFPLSRIVEDEIVRCCEDVEEWLAASHKQSS
jgi:hypothetical protein